MARTDSLTGAANRLLFDETLQAELARKRRHPGALSLIMFDIDRFKQVNDRHGHKAGDQVLRGLAELVAGAVRKTDVFARWGGEEFVVLLPDDPLEVGLRLAEKLRRLAAEHDFPAVGTVTISCGVAGLRAGDDADRLCKRADHALYEAKRQGRNRVVAERGATAQTADA